VTRHDAVVIGGGPAGATAACLLARAGWSVVVVEKHAFPRRKVCGEYLSATTIPLLQRLGIADAFADRAGPDVRRVGLWTGETCISAELPLPAGRAGRALGRERLDTLLLQAAADAGAEVRQPWSVVGLARRGELWTGATRSAADDVDELAAPVVIAAHGSWDAGPLATQSRKQTPRPDDLFGFKAHFRGTRLASGLMPLLAFPGGYGGLVHTDDARVSLSCCVRRDRLQALRGGSGAAAGDAIFDHILGHCRGAREALSVGVRDGSWLAAGPLRPGIRLRPRGGLLAVGNAAGEAHPVIAEGIAMAIQGAGLLAERLIEWGRAGRSRTGLEAVADEYGAAWRRAFAPRLHTAAAVAHWAMRPAAVTGVLPALRCYPRLLSWGARLSGKATRVS
jgi:flavin-dependent dehydrogenase